MIVLPQKCRHLCQLLRITFQMLYQHYDRFVDLNDGTHVITLAVSAFYWL